MNKDVILLYPKTSCVQCSTCDERKTYPQPKIEFKSNLAVPNCEYPSQFDCTDRLFLGSTPTREFRGITTVNPQVYTEKLSPGYKMLPCKNSCGTGRPAFISQDPRLYNVTLPQYLPLDSPPINGNVKLNSVYSETLDGYGNGFFPYEKIRDGQIQYYVDKSIQDPFFKPNFSQPANQVKVLYKDPMDSIKPEYTRMPVTNTENPVLRCQSEYPCTSFIQDTQGFREDLLSFQMRKRNQERWETFWS